MHDADRILLQAVARVVLSAADGTLEEQLESTLRGAVAEHARRYVRRTEHDQPAPAVELPHRDLIFPNGIGGFTPDGREYVITVTLWTDDARAVGERDRQPAVRNGRLRERQRYTWSENAHEFRLTPWHNDPVSDPSGEAFYLRDEESGRFWSPTPLPSGGAAPYVTRHGFGYSVFEHVEDGIDSELCVYVAIDAPVKFAVLKLRNVRAARAGSPSPATSNGCWATCAPKTAMHVAPRSTRTAARCSRATPTTPSSPDGSRSSTSTTPTRDA